MDTLIGKTLGQYQIQVELGRGGMATVYRAFQPSLNRSVAVKVLPVLGGSDPSLVARFRREAAVIAGLEHPNILPVYDYGEEGGILYIVMRLVTGGTLRERMWHPLDIPTAVKIASQVASALDSAHRRGVVHRDVKPSNILMAEPDWPLLSDFGIARMVESETQLTRTGVGLGTPQYMSPEQGLGRSVDARSDIYALGVILYEMLTGRVPFQADTPLGIIHQHVYEALPLPSALRPDIPPVLEAAVIKALAKQADERYQTGADLARALDGTLAGSVREVTHTLGEVRLRQLFKRRRWAVGAAVSGLAMIGVAGVLALAGFFGDGPPVGTGTEATAQAAAPTAPTLSVVPGESLYEDDFTDPMKGRWIGEEPNLSIKESKLNLIADVPGQWYRTWPANSPDAVDFVYEAEVTKIAGGNDPYGIFFRDKGNKHFYLFWISSAGNYGFGKFYGSGDYQDIIRTTESRAIKVGDNVSNKLKVEAIGNHFQLYVNNQFIAQADDDFSTAGLFGVYAETPKQPLHVAFSQVKLSQAKAGPR